MNDMTPQEPSVEIALSNARQMFEAVNAASRRIETLFPGFFSDAKHNHYTDFGFPQTVTFDMLYGIYSRNGIARSAIDKTILKSWQDNPEFCETSDPTETIVEKAFRLKLQDTRFWQHLSEIDRRSMVGGYAGAILRLKDGKAFDQPVGKVGGGVDGFKGLIPAWRSQLLIEGWDQDATSETYGEPTMYVFQEIPVDKNLPAGATGASRTVRVHPDRIILWSQDGTVFSRSSLEPGYNDLITCEKIVGAGGEGFWKNAKSAPVLDVDKDTKLEDMARAMGTTIPNLQQAMNDQVADFQKGFDKMLMLQGIKASQLNVTLPVPEQFFLAALQCFSASMNIPLKVLIGNQQGQRASTEDSMEWAQVNMSRRNNTIMPLLRTFLQRMIKFGILPQADWQPEWSDLLQTTKVEKIAIAKTLSDINASSYTANGEVIFTPDEIRQVADYEPLEVAIPVLPKPAPDKKGLYPKAEPSDPLSIP